MNRLFKRSLKKHYKTSSEVESIGADINSNSSGGFLKTIVHDKMKENRLKIDKISEREEKVKNAFKEIQKNLTDKDIDLIYMQFFSNASKLFLKAIQDRSNENIENYDKCVKEFENFFDELQKQENPFSDETYSNPFDDKYQINDV